MTVKFSGPQTANIVQAISRDLDDLGFVIGKEFILGPRNSGRTILLLREALHQLDFMDPGDEIWVVAHSWEHAKELCEFAANTLIKEMGFVRDLKDNFPLHLVERWGGTPNRVRYHLSFGEDKIIHFAALESLPLQLMGVHLKHNPAIFIDHVCYEFGSIQNADFDLYAVLQGVSRCF